VEGGDTVRTVGVRVAAVALVALVAALVRGWAFLLPLSVGLLGAVYAIHLRVDDVALDPRTPVLAAGLFATAELGYWSLEEREGIRADPGEGLRRLSVIAALAVAAVLVGAVLLALADFARVRGLVVDLLGAAAAAAVLAVLVATGRQAGR
jgi:hypothetical protein